MSPDPAPAAPVRSAAPAASAAPARPRSVERRAVWSWYLFDWATQPFFTLIVTFLYGPYFATSIAANEVEGQALWGYAAAAAGVLVALLAPFFGAVADRSGRRKPWIVAFSVLLCVGCYGLWFGTPGAGDAVLLVLASYVIATVGAEFATVFTNAMMPDLVPGSRLGRLSGTGAAVGYVGGLVSLVLVLALIDADPATGLTRFGVPPLFGLIPATGSTAAIGPFSALWYAVFVLPLFVLVPDRPTRAPVGAALSEGLGALVATLKDASVAILTDAFDSQRWGAAVIPLFPIAGLVLMRWVHRAAAAEPAGGSV